MKKLIITGAVALLLAVSSVPAFAAGVNCPNGGACTNSSSCIKNGGTGGGQGYRIRGNRDTTKVTMRAGGNGSGVCDGTGNGNGECVNGGVCDGTGRGNGNGTGECINKDGTGTCTNTPARDGTGMQYGKGNGGNGGGRGGRR